MDKKTIYTYLVIIFILIIVVSLFIYFELYKHEKYKVSISLFIAFNVLLTAYILLSQTNNHSEQIADTITENNSRTVDNCLTAIVKDMNLNYRNSSQLYKELFVNNKDNKNQNDDNLYTNFNDDFNKNNEISPIDEAICLQILSSISDHCLYYYNHIDLASFTTITKRQNYRMLKIINWYLEAPTFRNYLENFYLETMVGLYTLKYFKEFFNISQKHPIIEEEKLIADNKIIDGKVNGTIEIVAPTTRKSDLFFKY